MTSNNKSIFLPALLVALGTGWLLTTLGVAPSIDWAWTLSVAILGVMTLIVGGLDKITVVIGPILILGSCLSILRQTGRLSFDVEVPILVIILGVLLFVARISVVPVPGWMIQDSKSGRRDSKN